MPARLDIAILIDGVLYIKKIKIKRPKIVSSVIVLGFQYQKCSKKLKKKKKEK